MTNRKLIGVFVAMLAALAVAFIATSIARAEDDQLPLRETDGISVRGISFLDGGRMMISFDMGSDFAGGNFHALVAVSHDKEFKCLTLDEYPGRLYCVGRRVQDGMIARIRLVNSDTGEVLIETLHSTPVRPTPEPRQPEPTPTSQPTCSQQDSEHQEISISPCNLDR